MQTKEIETWVDIPGRTGVRYYGRKALAIQ